MNCSWRRRSSRSSFPPDRLWSVAIHPQIFVFRHGNVANHQGDVALTPHGRGVAFNTGVSLSDDIADGQSVSILYSPSARTLETAEELALGMAYSLRSHAGFAVRIALPRAEPAIRNFHFIVEGQLLPPMDRMHPSYPAAALQDSYLAGFWSAEEDRIGYWMSHPSESAESPAAVTERLSAFFQSLLDAGSQDVSVLVTHSGPMRAFLRAAYGVDPGEPEFCESFRVDASGVSYRGVRVPRPARNGSSS